MVMRMISTDYSKSEEIFKHVDNIVMQVKETQEEFIFSTLSKYAMDNFNAVVEKEELVQAIQLIRMCKEHGPRICERWTTATQQTAHLNDAYKRGYVERDTRCDLCDNKSECEDYLIDCTRYEDTRRHVINGMGHICPKRYKGE